jgi:hypothetical protein
VGVRRKPNRNVCWNFDFNSILDICIVVVVVVVVAVSSNRDMWMTQLLGEGSSTGSKSSRKDAQGRRSSRLLRL